MAGASERMTERADDQPAHQLGVAEAHFGFRMGADRQLADADAIERYFERVDAASDRVRLVDIGPTTQGRRTVAAIQQAGCGS